MSSEIQRARFVLFLLSFWALSSSVPEQHQLLAFLIHQSTIGRRSNFGGSAKLVGVKTKCGRLRIPFNSPVTTYLHGDSLLSLQEEDYGGNPRLTKPPSKTTSQQSLPNDEDDHAVVSSSSLSSRPSRPYRRPLQQRRSTVQMGSWNRKPRFYWKDVQNIEQELRRQWEAALMLGNRGNDDDDDDDDDDDERRNNDMLDIVHKFLPPDRPPPIPNEALLNHWKRNDLRAAIRQFGRHYLAELLLLEQRDDDVDDTNRDGPAVNPALTDAMVVPGKWKEAIQWPIVRHVVQVDDRLSMDLAPPSPQRVRLMKEDYNMTEKEIKEWMHSGRWQYGNSTSHAGLGRKEKGFWSKRTVMEALFQYLKERKETRSMPSIWMPRLSELDLGLRLAIIKYFGKGSKAICQEGGLVPFREWIYIERQHDLMVTLRDYLDEHHDGDYTIFPQYVRLRDEGHNHLFRLIQDFGGRRFVAARFGMQHHQHPSTGNNRNEVDVFTEMNWGPFDLDFGITLLDFVRTQQMRKEPPLRHPMIAMPTKADLLSHVGTDDNDNSVVGVYLDQKIVEYGGYENVARRLGLEYFVPGNVDR